MPVTRYTGCNCKDNQHTHVLKCRLTNTQEKLNKRLDDIKHNWTEYIRKCVKYIVEVGLQIKMENGFRNTSRDMDKYKKIYIMRCWNRLSYVIPDVVEEVL